jgi:hypothetical protein
MSDGRPASWMITFSSINFETEISTFGGVTNFTDERLLPDREIRVVRSEVWGGRRPSVVLRPSHWDDITGLTVQTAKLIPIRYARIDTKASKEKARNGR